MKKSALSPSAPKPIFQLTTRTVSPRRRISDAEPAGEVVAHMDGVQVAHGANHQRKPDQDRDRKTGNGAEREAPKTPESPRHVDLQAFRIGARHENVHERVHEITDEKSRHKEHRTVPEPRGEDEYDLRNKHSTCGSGTQDAEGAETEAREKRDRHP